MHIFLTGASGFIGKNLLNGLLNAGYRVTAVIRPDSSHKNLLPKESKQLHYEFGYFYDPTFLQTLQAQFDAVIHVAAVRGAGRADPKQYRLVNVQGTRILCEFALKQHIPRFLYVSTVGVLGTIPQHLPAKAQDSPRPDNIYHQTKWQAEEFIRGIPKHALKTLILRPTITYGAYDDGFIPHVIRLIKNKRLILPRNPVLVHLLSVKSLTRLINQILALDLFNGKTYTVADRDPVALQAIADLVQSHIGGGYHRVPEFIFKAGRMIFSLLGRADLHTGLQLISQSWYYDITPLQNDFLFEPLETLNELPEIMATFV